MNNCRCQELEIGGKQFLIGISKADDVRKILITNFNEFYEEKLTRENILERCEELNPSHDFDAEDIVDDLLLNISKYIHPSSTINNIKLENRIEDGRFEFYISPQKCSSEVFNGHFLESLYISFSELHHRYNCLLDIVKAKDQEIAEYKAEGVQLTRKSLITEAFTEDLFKTKLKNTKTVNKINIFLNALNFYNSVKDFQNKDNMKEESLDVRLIKDQLSNKSNVKKSTKRPSSDVRCAVAPKMKTSTKILKPKSEFKFL